VQGSEAAQRQRHQKLLFDAIPAFSDRHGKLMHGGTIVDATIIEAPTSTKNAEKQRDP
jgi:IS5 family transposase